MSGQQNSFYFVRGEKHVQFTHIHWKCACVRSTFVTLIYTCSVNNNAATSARVAETHPNVMDGPSGALVMIEVRLTHILPRSQNSC